jgi:pSer/pThr/pTyr-binding forkhead associated (FHA) protein
MHLEDAETGTRHAVAGTVCVLGRDAGAHLRFDDVTVARRHARLTLAGGRWSIEDMKSSGGTFVNGEIVRTSRVLHEGDVIQLAAVRVVVRLGDAGP